MDELAGDVEVVGGPSARKRREKIDRGNKAVPPAAAQQRVFQASAERLDPYGVQPHQPDVAQRRGQFAAVFEFRNALPGPHGSADVQQQAHGYARLDLKHLQKQFFQA